MYVRYFDYELDEALPTCEEEYGDRFDDYADEDEIINHDPEDFDDWSEPESIDEYMHRRL